jgi:hypothetical protein
MDLNPSEIQDLQIENNIRILQEDRSEHYTHINFNNCDSIYLDEGVNKLVSDIREKTLHEIIEKLRTYAEANDAYMLYYYLTKIKQIRFGNNIKPNECEEIIQILDLYIKQHYQESELMTVCMSIMIDLIAMKGIKLRLDWKVYYKIFMLAFTIPKYEFAKKYHSNTRSSNLVELIKRAYKYFIFAEDDYRFLRGDLISRFCTIDGQLSVALLIGYLFLPSDYLAEDEDMQKRLMCILENQPHCSHYVLLIFSNFMKNGIKVNREDFIEKVFSLAFLVLTDGANITYFSWPETVYKDKDCKLSLCYILAVLLTHKDFVEYREIIDKKFNIVVNLLNVYLTENTASHSADYTFSFVRLIIRYLKSLVCHTTEKQISEYDSSYETTILEEYKTRVEEICSKLHPIMTKCLLYSDKSSFTVFLEYITFIDNNSITESQFSILSHLFENRDMDFELFVRKINFFMKPLFENVDRKEIYNFIIDIVDVAVDKISSINSKQNNTILDFFNLVFLRCSNKQITTYKKGSNTDKLLTHLNDLSTVLIKKILQLYSFFAGHIDGLIFNLFYTHLSFFVKPETLDEINKLVIEYLGNNILKEEHEFSHLQYFLRNILFKEGCKVNLSQSIWDICYTNLVEKVSTKVEHKDINKIDHEVGEYDVTHLTKEHFDHYKKLMKTVCFYAYNLDVTEKFENQLFTIAKLFLNEKVSRRKILYEILYLLPFNLILIGQDGNGKLTLPDSKKLLLLTKIYDKMILPYKAYIENKFDEFKDQGEDFITQSKKEAQDLEEVLVIYLRLSKGFILRFENLFMNEELGLKYPGILEQYDNKQKDIYGQLIAIRKSVTESITSFYEAARELGVVVKSEKYFRRSFFTTFLETDKSSYSNMITTYRKYIYYYREIKYDDFTFIINKYVLNVMRNSHIRLITQTSQKDVDFKNLKYLMKSYVKNSDKVINGNSMFNFVTICKSLQPDSEASIKIFDSFFNHFEKWINKIPVTNQPLISDIDKFNRLTSVLMATIDVCYTKVSDIAYLLRKVFKFRIMISRFKYDVSALLKTLRDKTHRLIHLISKSTYLFKRKTKIWLSDYLLNDELELGMNQLTLQENFKKSAMEKANLNRGALRELIKDYSDFSCFSSNNYHDNIYMVIDYFRLIDIVLSRGNKDDEGLLNALEEKVFKTFIAEKDIVYKSIFLYALVMFYNMRYKHSKEYIEETGEVDTTDMKKNNLSNGKRFRKNYSNVVIPYLNTLVNNDDQLFLLVSELYHLQEDRNYHNLLNKEKDPEIASIFTTMLYLINPQDQSTVLTLGKDYQIVNVSETKVLFNVVVNKLFFYLSYFTSFDNHDKIFEVYEKLKKVDKSDEVVCMNILVTFLGGVFKKDKILGKFEAINYNIQKLMRSYTYNCNKRVDSEILNIFSMVIRMATPNEARTMLFNKDKEHLVIFDYDNIVSMKTYHLLWERYRNVFKRILCEFDYKMVYNIMSNVFNDQILWIKNLSMFENFYISYLHTKYITIHDSDPFTISYESSISEHIAEIYSLYQKTHTKEALRLLNILIIESILFTAANPHQLIPLLDVLNDYIELDNQKYKVRFTWMNKILHNNLSFKSLNLTEIIDQMTKKIASYDHPEKITFFTGLIRQLYLPRLHLLNKESTNLFRQLTDVLGNIKFKDCHECFCNDILFYLIQSTDDTNQSKEIDILFNNIDECFKTGDKKGINSNLVVLTTFLLTYELYIKPITERIIMQMNSFNSKLFKNKGNESNVIKKCISRFYNRYTYTYSFVKKQLSDECIYAIENLSKSHSYFL